MSQRRVVITGMGAVTPIGHSVEETWKSVMAGECGIDKITLFDTTDYWAGTRGIWPSMWACP